MNISGVVVHTRPEKSRELVKSLTAVDGVEVHAAQQGRLVVTVEENDVRSLADKVTGLQDIPGVISVAMIYHHSEEIEDQQDTSDFPLEAEACACNAFKVQEASS